jgi:hypothetical protein
MSSRQLRSADLRRNLADDYRLRGPSPAEVGLARTMIERTEQRLFCP